MSASSNGDQSGRRTTSRRRAGLASSTSDSARSTRHTASNVSYKDYFDAEDNYDPEILDDHSPNPKSSNNDCEITKTVSSPSKLSRKQSKASVSNGEINSEKIENLISITGLDRQEAASLLEACNNSVENAVEIHFGTAVDPNKSKSNFTNRHMLNGFKSSSLSSSSTVSAVPRHFTNGNGMKSANKRTHNDIDNNDLISVDEDSSSSSSGGVNFSNGVNYSNGGIDVGENVRAPIPPKIDRLVDYDPYAFELASQNSKRSRLAYDGFRNMKEEFNDGLTSGSKSLSALFRPPVDLLFDGSFEASKTKACNLNKWVMLNVQCQTDFNSKCLNRDIWSDETVKEIIKANFVFVQIYFDSVEGNKLVNIYNIHSYPFIAILDPRTGEKLVQYQSTKLDPCSFCERLTNFLCENEPDFKSSTSDAFELANNNNEEVIIIDDKKKVEINGSSKSYVNGFSSQHKKQEKLKRADDILNSNLIETIEDSPENNEIYAIDNLNENKKMNDSYEDESVISKDKYDKMKQASKLASNQESTDSKTSEKTSLPQSTTAQITPSINTSENHQPIIIKYQTQIFDKKDCFLRILYPNGDRLDFTTNGESNLKELQDYLIGQGFNTKNYELIERLMPNFGSNSQVTVATTSANANTHDNSQSILNITEQSRNLFKSDPNQTFKQLKLFPRVFLLLQES